MKKVLSSLTISVFVLALAFISFAEAKEAKEAKSAEPETSNSLRKNAGCGWGTNLWEGSDGLLSQYCAIGTNHGFCGNQEFGILSQTLGCEKFEGLFGSNSPVSIFVADNMDYLARDMAKGNGEYLITLAILMHVTEENRSGFYTKMQSNFSNIFTSANITSSEVVKNIASTMEQS